MTPENSLDPFHASTAEWPKFATTKVKSIKNLLKELNYDERNENLRSELRKELRGFREEYMTRSSVQGYKLNKWRSEDEKKLFLEIALEFLEGNQNGCEFWPDDTTSRFYNKKQYSKDRDVILRNVYLILRQMNVNKEKSDTSKAKRGIAEGGGDKSKLRKRVACTHVPSGSTCSEANALTPSPSSHSSPRQSTEAESHRFAKATFCPEVGGFTGCTAPEPPMQFEPTLDVWSQTSNTNASQPQNEDHRGLPNFQKDAANVEIMGTPPQANSAAADTQLTEEPTRSTNLWRDAEPGAEYGRINPGPEPADERNGTHAAGQRRSKRKRTTRQCPNAGSPEEVDELDQLDEQILRNSSKRNQTGEKTTSGLTRSELRDPRTISPGGLASEVSSELHRTEETLALLEELAREVSASDSLNLFLDEAAAAPSRQKPKRHEDLEALQQNEKESVNSTRQHLPPISPLEDHTELPSRVFARRQSGQHGQERSTSLEQSAQESMDSPLLSPVHPTEFPSMESFGDILTEPGQVELPTRTPSHEVLGPSTEYLNAQGDFIPAETPVSAVDMEGTTFSVANTIVREGQLDTPSGCLRSSEMESSTGGDMAPPLAESTAPPISIRTRWPARGGPAKYMPSAEFSRAATEPPRARQESTRVTPGCMGPPGAIGAVASGSTNRKEERISPMSGNDRLPKHNSKAQKRTPGKPMILFRVITSRNPVCESRGWRPNGLFQHKTLAQLKEEIPLMLDADTKGLLFNLTSPGLKVPGLTVPKLSHEERVLHGEEKEFEIAKHGFQRRMQEWIAKCAPSGELPNFELEIEALRDEAQVDTDEEVHEEEVAF